MRTFGLIGFPLSHSFSKKFFSQKFVDEHISDCRYELFPIKEVGDLPQLLEANPSLCGLNVTIPHKVNIIPFLNEMDGAARAIGAVNCISISQKNGLHFLKGYNTDAFGFTESLKPLLKYHHQKALIFGDGGAAKAVKYSLEQLGLPFTVVTRNPSGNAILYDQVSAQLLKDHQVLINTTPLGMMPHEATLPPIPYELLTTEHLLYDLVYNPLETLFMKKAEVQGATVKNGLEMLYLQAERSWYIWNNADEK